MFENFAVADQHNHSDKQNAPIKGNAIVVLVDVNALKTSKVQLVSE